MIHNNWLLQPDGSWGLVVSAHPYPFAIHISLRPIGGDRYAGRVGLTDMEFGKPGTTLEEAKRAFLRVGVNKYTGIARQLHEMYESEDFCK